MQSDGETRSLCRQLMQDGKLAAVQKALNNRIGSSYSGATACQLLPFRLILRRIAMANH